MLDDIERVLISRERIDARVRELAAEITRDHAPVNPEDKFEITIVPILTGAIIFACDLMRQIPFALKIGLMTVSSYPGVNIRSQGASILSKQLGDIHGRHILLIDDILDS